VQSPCFCPGKFRLAALGKRRQATRSMQDRNHLQGCSWLATVHGGFYRLEFWNKGTRFKIQSRCARGCRENRIFENKEANKKIEFLEQGGKLE